MKKIIFSAIMLLGLSIFKANAQFAKARPGNYHRRTNGHWKLQASYRWVPGHWR